MFNRVRILVYKNFYIIKFYFQVINTEQPLDFTFLEYFHKYMFNLLQKLKFAN